LKVLWIRSNRGFGWQSPCRTPLAVVRELYVLSLLFSIGFSLLVGCLVLYTVQGGALCEAPLCVYPLHIQDFNGWCKKNILTRESVVRRFTENVILLASLL